jgi:hypothetical protein
MTRRALRHQGAITVALVGALLLNLLVVGRFSPPGPPRGDLPMASHCQGGGPGCAEQPLIPPPVGGLPHFDATPAPEWGAATIVEPAPLAAATDPPPVSIEHPPALTFA